MAKNNDTIFIKFSRKANNERAVVTAEGERLGDYIKKGLYEIFYNLVELVFKDENRNLDLTTRTELIYDEFNSKINLELKEKSKKTENLNYFFNEQQYSKQQIVVPYSDMFNDVFLSEEQKQYVQALLNEFIENYNKITSYKYEQKINYNYPMLISYLDSYLKLCKFIFTPNCLCQAELRTSKIIETFLNIDYNPIEQTFGIASPVIIFSLVRTLNYIAELPDEINSFELGKECESLNTRKHIIATYAIRSFSHFTTIDGETCSVEYSRRKDRIVCKNLKNVSSIDNVKPIRLLEKMTSYIYNTLNDSKYDDEKSFKISIYGFCWSGTNAGESPVEVDDLVYEIFSWFKDMRELVPQWKNKNLGEISIDYYISGSEIETNSFEYIYEYKRDSKEKNDAFIGECHLKIYTDKQNKYGNAHLEETIKNSDLIFILDCPWIATEDFNLDAHGDLNSFGNWIQKASFKEELLPQLVPEPESPGFFDRKNLFSNINDQFNRLAVVNCGLRYGKIVRVVKDYLLIWIQETISKYKNDGVYKSVYVYNSSLRGMLYSNFATYPIVRDEVYSNKRFTIMRFSTRDSTAIKVENGDDNEIKISLWSLLKYVDISFAFLGIKDYFSNELVKYLLDCDNEKVKRNIISILRNIIFVLNYNNTAEPFRNVKIQLKTTKILSDFYNDNLEQESKIIDFFEEILKNIIFNNSSGLGDCCIRDAFERCLYNQSKTVDDLFFLHYYTQKKNMGSLSYFNVEFESENMKNYSSDFKPNVPDFDSFGDKRIYQKLFSSLDVVNVSDYGIHTLLSQGNRNFKFKNLALGTHSQEMLSNIKEVCEKYNYTNSYLYSNVTDFI